MSLIKVIIIKNKLSLRHKSAQLVPPERHPENRFRGKLTLSRLQFTASKKTYTPLSLLSLMRMGCDI